MKILPHDFDAEQCVIGCCLIDKYSVTRAVEALTKEDFYDEVNQIMFFCISNLFNRSEPVDIITMKNELENIGQLEKVGGLEGVSSFPERVPTAANIEHYIKIVSEKSTNRKLINLSNEIARNGFDATISIDSLLDFAEKEIFEITQKKNTKGASNLQDLLNQSIKNLEDITQNGKRKGIPTGFAGIDRRMGGLKGSELLILAARPGMGKSAFALNIATNVAKKEKIPVLIFNLEMGEEQLTDRIICSDCLIDSKRYSEGKLNDEEWKKLAVGLSWLSKAKIFIDDNSSITMSDIRARCRKMVMDEQIGLVIIDYLQLITPTNPKESKVNQIGEISRSLKVLAKELKIPVIALSQLSRENEKRKGQDKRPVLSDLRDSGAIEQDADIVMFIHREDYYDAEKRQISNIAEINIAKFRSGEPGTEKVAWLGEYTKFMDLEREK